MMVSRKGSEGEFGFSQDFQKIGNRSLQVVNDDNYAYPNASNNKIQI